MNKKIVCLGILLARLIFLNSSSFIGTNPQSEKPAGTLTLDQLTTAAKHYFRDTAEFPLLQKTTFAVVDASGRARKVQNVSAEYVFRGYNRGTKTAGARIHGEVSMWAGMTGAKTFKASTNSAVWTIVAGEELFADPGEFIFQAGETGKPNGILTASLKPAQPCPAVTMNDHAAWYVPDHRCGSGEFLLNSDLSFQKFTMDVAGLPASVELDPFGQCTLQRYHAEVEFQSVAVQGQKEPFLVPKLVTATIETNKGKIIITSVYEPSLAARPH
jgi:hypothetical protein